MSIRLACRFWNHLPTFRMTWSPINGGNKPPFSWSNSIYSVCWWRCPCILRTQSGKRLPVSIRSHLISETPVWVSSEASNCARPSSCLCLSIERICNCYTTQPQTGYLVSTTLRRCNTAICPASQWRSCVSSEAWSFSRIWCRCLSKFNRNLATHSAEQHRFYAHSDELGYRK